MSGGHWDYANDTLAGEVLGYDYYVDYGLNSERHNKYFKKAVREHPLEDPEISALVFDVFCLLHSYDWAVSADTSMDVYLEDVAIFKKRWFKTARKEQIRTIVDTCVDGLKDDLYQAFRCADETEGEQAVQ